MQEYKEWIKQANKETSLPAVFLTFVDDNQQYAFF